MRLNLGAANRHVDSFLCVDIAPPPCLACDAAMAFDGHQDTLAARTVNLEQEWPWHTSSVEEVLALDVAEHVGSIGADDFRESQGFAHPARHSGPRSQRHGRIWFLNELHRVLVPGGRATIETPNAARGVGYFQDLTHCSPYCLSSFKYVEHGAFARERLGDAYGISARFKVLSLTESRSNGEDPREEVWKIKAVLECVK